MNKFAERLRQERVRVGMTQEELGKIGGVGPNAQGSYERATTIPRADYLSKIATTGMDILFVLTGKPTPSIVAKKVDGITGTLDAVHDTYSVEVEMLKALTTSHALSPVDLRVFCESQVKVIEALKLLVTLAESQGYADIQEQIFPAVEGLNIVAKMVAQGITHLAANTVSTANDSVPSVHAH